jgi:Fibronectin type III-like domain
MPQYGKPRHFALVLLLGVSLSAAAALAQDAARPVASGASTGNARVDKLLAQMTLKEKISLLHGALGPATTSIGAPGYLPGLPRPAPAGAQFAKRSLVAFDRVHLEAGERKTFTFHIPPRRLSYWDEQSDQWSKPVGNRPLYVGASSRDINLTGKISSAD